MAWRTTEEDVRAIISTDSDNLIAPFIDTATAVVDYVESEDDNDVLTDALLREIEKYLAAHFYEHLDQAYTSKSTDGASAAFQGQFGMGLDSSKWGQTAKRLDVTGTLAAMDRTKHKITVEWLGKPVSEQTAYTDRD